MLGWTVTTVDRQIPIILKILDYFLVFLPQPNLPGLTCKLLVEVSKKKSYLSELLLKVLF